MIGTQLEVLGAVESSSGTPPPSGEPVNAPVDSPAPGPVAGDITIAFIGDSVTAGTEADARFSDYLVGAPSVSIQNYGLGSAGLTNSSFPIQSTQQWQDFLASGADIVWLMIGPNDIDDGATLNEYIAALNATIAEINQALGNPTIYVASSPPFAEFLPQDYQVYQSTWIPALQQAAATAGVNYVDLHAQVTDYPQNYPDGVHPNAQGAQTLASIVAQSIPEVVGTSTGGPVSMPGEPVEPPQGAPDDPPPQDDPTPSQPPEDPMAMDARDAPVDAATLVKLYIVFYGRLPDTPGYLFWMGKADENPSLSVADLAAVFSTEPEFETLYGGSTPGEIVQSFYRQVLGREPEGAGFSFWTNVLETAPSFGVVEMALGFVLALETDRIHRPAIDGFLSGFAMTTAAMNDPEMPAPPSETAMGEGDVFVFPESGFELIPDFDPATDRIDITGLGQPGDVQILDETDGTTLLLQGGDIFLPDVDAGQIVPDVFIF